MRIGEREVGASPEWVDLGLGKGKTGDGYSLLESKKKKNRKTIYTVKCRVSEPVNSLIRSPLE